jgi:hypothetical protein
VSLCVFRAPLKTADDNSSAKEKKKWFSDKHPDKWIPLYSRVTFSDRPYAEALAIEMSKMRLWSTF